MEGKVKQSRRSRSQRERGRKREARAGEAQHRSPSSGSERERSPGKNAPPRSTSSSKTPRPTRRKRRESSSQEEDIIDGFAIASFVSLDRLENKNVSVKMEKKKWEEIVVKQQKEAEENVTPDIDENGFGNLATSMGRDQERVKDRLLKNTYSKRSKRSLSLLSQAGKKMVETEVNTAPRSSSKDRLSESSTHSLSGRGYSCDSESDIDDKASDIGSEKLFSPTAPKVTPTKENLGSKTSSSTKVSGLQRSQEQSNDISFVPPISSPTPASPPTGSPAPAAAAAPAPRPHPLSTNPLTIKKESVPPNPTPSLLRNQSHSLEHRVPPPLHHSQPVISHRHHPLPYSSLHDISNNPSTLPPKYHLPHSPHHLSGLPSPAPPLPLSIAGLPSSHYSLHSPSHLSSHPAMFANPATLPPPPTLPTNSLVVPGHPAGPPYPDTSLLISFNQPIMYCQPHSGILIGTLSQATLLPPPMSPHVENPHTLNWRNRESQFDKYAPKLDNPFLRHSNFFPSYPPTMPGMPPMLPHSGPFSSLQGAFQPKASNPIDVAARPGTVPHTLLQKDPRITDPFRTSVRKPGKWCAVHVQIAWQIYHHQQKMKQMHLDPHKLDMNGKLDLFSRPPAPGVFPGFPYPHDLARPLFSSTGSGHPAASPYGPSPHHAGFLPPSHLAGKYPFSRSSTFGGLSNLSSSAFGGLGNPALGANSVFGPKEGPGLPGLSSPHHDTWNRLHRTPPSFPTPPQWPKSADAERSSSANSHDREREREREKEKERERDKRDSSIGKEEKDKDRDSLDRNRHSNLSSPASAPVSYQISSLIRSNSQNSTDSGRHRSGSADRNREPEKELLDRQREAGILGDIKVKESRSPEKGITDRRSSDDSLKSVHRSPSPYSKNVLNDAGIKMGIPQPPPMKESERDRKETSSGDLLQKVKNDMKIKEERKEEQDVMVVGSEAATKPQVPPPPPPHQTTLIAHHPALSHQPHPPSPRCSDPPTPSSLHGVPMPHSLPLTLSAMHQMGSLNALERTRMAPFMGVSPLAAGRDRLPHPAYCWDPLREAYRNLDLQRRMDFQLRSEPGHRFPGVYDPERLYRDREPHDYSHHEHLLEFRREQERLRQQAEERERLHLREELDRARLHQLHQSPIEGHLPHMPPFMSHLGGMPYPRLSPSTGHNGLLNRTPPTAALSAPPPLVPSGAARPVSPRRTTPITTQDPREYSPSRNPKEVEAR
ncbi:autism susceptibility gene 2 protein-like isoform X9 [Sinocyclocheilus anshuiensis]|uniref:autism susceptibility gene 2 protein-like isoform X9 n=1 Tax=Sinocyclocheilus anshuiensis TaxID=1608454 RepID=UPI0007B7DDEC|nr:PREDICTED: autism susceptibility gene 2 protein-like isoform X9 [Sinocyclocheilus anshuiensis]